MRQTKTIARQVHRQRAASLLSKLPTCKWVIHNSDVLDELGRIESDHALIEIAKRICQIKPSTIEAIEMVRRHREFDQLADELVHLVNDYRKRHPSTTRHEVLRALETAGMMLGKSTEVGEPGSHQFLRRNGI